MTDRESDRQTLALYQYCTIHSCATLTRDKNDLSEISFRATVCKMVRPMLSDRCLCICRHDAKPLSCYGVWLLSIDVKRSQIAGDLVTDSFKSKSICRLPASSASHLAECVLCACSNVSGVRSYSILSKQPSYRNVVMSLSKVTVT